MKYLFAVIILLGLSLNAQADVFNLGAGYTNLETVRVGDAGNAADTTGYGSVGYDYNIGKYEVTAGQYTDFLNNKAKTDTYGLYHTSMADITSSSQNMGCNIQRTGTSDNYSYSIAEDWANRPVNFVSYWDSCRFANWLSNGQGDGDTENGAYTLTADAISNNTVMRDANWKWAVTSEDEWYKAAYYDPNKMGGAGYWDYTTQSDFINTNMANYGMLPIERTTIVGSYAYSSAYGTFDQGGNLFEWNDAIRNTTGSVLPILRGERGGWYGGIQDDLNSSYRGANAPSNGMIVSGFRVVQAVPEPSSIIALLGGLAGLFGSITRRRII